jgi:AbrB family looped-hinge helix DNA binding protein
MLEVKVKVADGGRIVIPAEYRQALGVQIGDELMLRLEGQELHVYTIREAIRRAQAAIQRSLPPGAALADSLIADRRREAGQE